MSLNLKIFHALNSIAGLNSILDGLIYFCARYLPWTLLLCVFVFFIFRKSPKENRKIYSRVKAKDMLFVGSVIGFSWLMSSVLKSILYTPRPFLSFSDINVLLKYGSIDSFPSGHATLFGALAFSMFCIHRKIGAFFMIGAFLIGLARISAGLHFPADILSGYVIAGISAFIFQRVFYKRF